MDRERFDALARLLATTGPRRAVLGALLGADLLGRNPGALARPGKGKGRKRRGKRRRRNGGGGQEPEPPANCCGTEQCAPPESGSTRSRCDFAGQSFVGQDLGGSIFRGIDGRLANFIDTDLGGTVFAEACLFAASFRRARLGGSTWENACLFAADFTDADLGDDADALDEAVLCGTVMPDGSRNDRDCGNLPPCCRGGLGGSRPCARANDCEDLPCFDTACSAGQCGYSPVSNGPSPNALCDTRCCNTVCCPSAADVCDRDGRCCSPVNPFACGNNTCALACGETCKQCATPADGGVLRCGEVVRIPCSPCSSVADCPNDNACITSFTFRGGPTLRVPQICQNQTLLATCATIQPCP
jgi:hypothetical protein